MSDELIILAVQSFEAALVELARIVQKAVRPAMESIVNYFWECYRQAGSPYGDSDEGLALWLKELVGDEDKP